MIDVQTQRNGLKPVRAYLPMWAQQLLTVLQTHPGLLRSELALTMNEQVRALAQSRTTTTCFQGENRMPSPPSLCTHPGGRDDVVDEMQNALYRGLMSNDDALIDHAMDLDRRLTRRASLRDASASTENSAPLPSDRS